MLVSRFRFMGVRCFEDTGNVELSRRINLIVGPNNSGKSTLIRALALWGGVQYLNFDDLRKPKEEAQLVVEFTECDWLLSPYRPQPAPASVAVTYRISRIAGVTINVPGVMQGNSCKLFNSEHPNNFIFPYLSGRKTAGFDEHVGLAHEQINDGTLSNLVSRITMLASFGHPDHETFVTTCREVIGLDITTAASLNGRKVGIYLDRTTFIPLERMGDGLAHMVGLIAGLCVSEGKLFLIEELENDLHPSALKAMLRLIDRASAKNQFVLTTHSNIVMRNLGGVAGAKTFRLSRPATDPIAPTTLCEVATTPRARQDLLEELGYDFGDFDLWRGWLFLEESSAEEIVREYLIPWFVPTLKTMLRTYSAQGATKLEARFDDFNRLVVFVHLQPVYQGRVWIIADGDPAGQQAITQLRAKYTQLTPECCFNFRESQFERYYPTQFAANVARILAIADAGQRRAAKTVLLQSVKEWIATNAEEAKVAFAASAVEVITTLEGIARALVRR